MGWTRGPVIGRGSSATVCLATASTGEVFAVKSTELSSSNSLEKEQSILSQLCSPYIVEYVGRDITCENNKTMYNILMEYMPGGSLSDLVKKQGNELEESLIQVYIYQILKGLEYLHSNGIVHCDIKGQNVLIGETGVKIADLGCAKMVKKDGNSANNTISGTPLFMAPEVARSEEQGFGADIWALGCTFLEMATGGAAPWPDSNDPVATLYKIGHLNDVPRVPSWLSENAKDFLNRCFKRDPKQRWTAQQLLEHPFLREMVENLPEKAKVMQNSPTSILDQGLWDSVEAPKSSSSSSEGPSENVVSFSPAARINRLSSSSDAMLPKWTEDENWLTVRGIVSEKSTQFCHQNLDVNQEFMDEELPNLMSSSFGEVIERSPPNEGLLFNQSVDDINRKETSEDRISESVPFWDIDEDEFVSTLLDFEGNAAKKLLPFVSISKFPLSSILF